MKWTARSSRRSTASNQTVLARRTLASTSRIRCADLYRCSGPSHRGDRYSGYDLVEITHQSVIWAILAGLKKDRISWGHALHCIELCFDLLVRVHYSASATTARS